MVLISSSKSEPLDNLSSQKNNINNIPQQVKKRVPVKTSEENSIVQPQIKKEDIVENNLRPDDLDTYIGQKELKESLKISILAAKQRNEPMDHLLLYGPPGLGKTTLSMIIAREMGVSIKITSAPALERPRDIAGILTSLKDFDVLFIDEIHRLNKVTEEILYPAMEDFSLDITIGKGTTAKIKRLPLKHFTLVGATTKAGSLTSPLRDRFGLISRLNFYEIDELKEIILRSSKILKVNMSLEGAEAIAQRARGTPRIANRILKRVRDYAQVKNESVITASIAENSLNLLNIDHRGLEPTDRAILKTIIENYNGGPVGIETIAAATSEDVATIEDVYEPYLLQIGFLNRTPRGRIVTHLAYKHLDKWGIS
ncbi:MAG: Holliday junction branch migration DNA helicase RuvB [Candidatus Sericytochromatia bacterium]|nr:Holliday junction branch migration DNA helicase RuvB [Candidatus Sericytochromatia bacterium]